MSTTQQRLEKILSTPIAGNAWQDMPLMDAIHDFIVDPSTTREQKKVALRMLNDNVMGLDPMTDVDADLDTYLAGE